MHEARGKFLAAKDAERLDARQHNEKSLLESIADGKQSTEQFTENQTRTDA